MPVSFLAIGATELLVSLTEEFGAPAELFSVGVPPQEASSIALTARTNRRGFILVVSPFFLTSYSGVFGLMVKRLRKPFPYLLRLFSLHFGGGVVMSRNLKKTQRNLDKRKKNRLHCGLSCFDFKRLFQLSRLALSLRKALRF